MAEDDPGVSPTVPNGTHSMVLYAVHETKLGLIASQTASPVGLVIAPREPFPEELLEYRATLHVTVEEEQVSAVEAADATGEDIEAPSTIGAEGEGS